LQLLIVSRCEKPALFVVQNRVVDVSADRWEELKSV